MTGPGKVIYWEVYNKFNFDYMNQWYMNNPISILENETQRNSVVF